MIAIGADAWARWPFNVYRTQLPQLQRLVAEGAGLA